VVLVFSLHRNSRVVLFDCCVVVLSIGCQQALILGHTRAQGKNLAQCGHYGLTTGDLPLAFVFDHMLSLFDRLA
jgi:hypothetical protein